MQEEEGKSTEEKELIFVREAVISVLHLLSLRQRRGVHVCACACAKSEMKSVYRQCLDESRSIGMNAFTEGQVMT